MGQPELLAALGDFFVVEEPVEGSWRTVDELLVGPALGERVDWTRSALARLAGGEVDERVAASTASLGIFARLISPPIGARVLGLDAPVPTTLRWRTSPTGQIRLAAPRWSPPDLGDVLTTLIAPLAERFETEYRLSPQILRGNAASAAGGAMRMVVRTDRHLSSIADALMRELLEHPFLVGTADIGPPFRRRSCCLYYRLPGGGYCGDCVLAS